VLLNGRVRLPSGELHVVEIQLHLRALFELKHDLHTLYNASRLLGIARAAGSNYDGAISDDVIEAARAGKVRQINCSHTMLEPPMRDKVAALFALDPCPLLELSLTEPLQSDGQRAFTGKSLEWLLHGGSAGPAGPAGPSGFAGLAAADGVAVAPSQVLCQRLRVLKLSRSGLSGPIPTAIGLCRELQRLLLNENELHGDIPAEIGQCTKLVDLFLAHNQISGGLEALGPCSALKQLRLEGNRLRGEVPVEAMSGMRSLEELKLDRNPQLLCNTTRREALRAALPPECKITWQDESGH
jgi:hypothetical protein